MTIRLLIVDDHAMFREGLRLLLEQQNGFMVVGEASDAATAVHLAQEQQPDVILMDVSLPGPSGIEATRQILAGQPGTKVIALTMHDDQTVISEMIQAGASGYVVKNARAAEIVQVVRAVAAGGMAMNSTATVRFLDQYRRLASAGQLVSSQGISQRERLILQLLAKGASNQEIADTLALSRQTVKNILSGIYAKLNVHSRTEAVIVALQAGLIQTGHPAR